MGVGPLQTGHVANSPALSRPVVFVEKSMYTEENKSCFFKSTRQIKYDHHSRISQGSRGVVLSVCVWKKTRCTSREEYELIFCGLPVLSAVAWPPPPPPHTPPAVYKAPLRSIMYKTHTCVGVWWPWQVQDQCCSASVLSTTPTNQVGCMTTSSWGVH